MTRKQANNLIGFLGGLVVALMVAVISILSFDPSGAALRSGGADATSVTQAKDVAGQFRHYTIAAALRLNNSPFSPEAAF
ncbi:MAG: hypothetical protein K2M19_08645 [Muribaculaceae bacterium]|nr:hypothetical protein [Muribaculaceae bacterium]